MLAMEEEFDSVLCEPIASAWLEIESASPAAATV
jgi:hypothetical protein